MAASVPSVAQFASGIHLRVGGIIIRFDQPKQQRFVLGVNAVPLTSAVGARRDGTGGTMLVEQLLDEA